MEYTVQGVKLQYSAEGERSWGEDRVLLDQGCDLTKGKSWHEPGFTLESLFDHRTNAMFFDAVATLLKECWKSAGLTLGVGIPLDQYHTMVTDLSAHLAAVDKTRLLPVSDFPLGIQAIEDRVSTICGIPLVARNPFDGQSIFHFRVIRPGQQDNNPLHRDVWLEDYDDCINLYIPVAGSNAQSALILIPGSHCWPESRIEKTREGANINGIQYNVPAITALRGAYEFQRPNPGPHQFLVFSPYLVHGGAINLNPDTTRISIEMRLWKK
jgi:hypothetical protein